ncbi:glycine--tRNA ligase beta subunit [Kordiimonas sediminis]|uniref:Glycine--tRNA ligase beta subunit n=1 Tax=Kordiimonas sediminis TaxID=1735581 RepID=A0A919ASI8_9PROT|nr:glycine--tRNA ligase subunit beta [Kordiimonas sediminis]GHF23290.1 glycine--tRNA ligase beta subunit [Kordiimonas sediminis]
MADLLIELFSEEIPARMQTQAARDLSKLVTDGLKEAGLTFDEAPAFVTPRRLTLCVNGLPDKTPDISEERRGPRTDAPEKALEGFMRGAGVTRDQLEEREEKKGTFFFAKIEKPGRPTGDVVAEVLEATIRNFPWPKSQRWGSSSLKWVRPLRNILCILDGAAVDLTVDGFTANNKTFGHRFMAPEWFEVTDFADYEQKLLDHKVIVNADKRADAIAAGISSLTSEKGLEWVEDKGLLREVAGLVEWPVPLMGSFDPAFMAVPEEVLILTMKKDQKYFVTRNPETGDLAPYFITVANTETVDGGAMVRDGNERVLSARLADAKFFWDQDLKGRLDDNLAALDDIVFHIELGKVSDRVARMKSLARKLADFIPGCDATEAERAAELAKADLVSQMVYEFPEVQGVMGRYYAKAQGETDAVADAIRDHYAPAGPSDTCPTAPVSVAVALAEKLDTLVGFFGIDQKPTGSKDPYALRRAALAVIRLITENGIRLSLQDAVNAGIASFAAQSVAMKDTSQDFGLLAFFGDRLKVQQRDLGVRHDLIDAVFAKGDDDLVRILGRVDALGSFLGTDDGVNLLAGYKRAANILKIEEKKDGTEYGADVSAALLSQEEEITLFEALGAAETDALVALEQENFEASMTALSTLRAPIDAFFDKVTVNADDAVLRANRLALLAKIRAAVNTVADFGQIEG